jgi:hypothetical protein
MDKFKVNDILNRLAYKPDVFICCVSYETRCKTIAGYLVPGDSLTALICSNIENRILLLENENYLTSRFANNHYLIYFSLVNPITTADNINMELSKISKQIKLNYLVDISTFTHESLLILFKLLLIHKKNEDNISFVYNNASEYCPGKPLNEKWLSNGVEEVRSVLGYSGTIMPSRNSHLIILVGYEHERASELIRVFEPEVISLGYGKSGSETGEKYHETNMYYLELVKKTVATNPKVNTFEFSSNDPLDTKKAILNKVGEYPEYNTIVAPMNTKLSTIGAGLASLANEKIQICYARALQYNYQNYSSPGDDCYLIEFSELFK